MHICSYSSSVNLAPYLAGVFLEERSDERRVSTVAPKQSTKKVLTSGHKDALKRGLEEARTIAFYLELLKEKPKPGRKRTLASVKKQLETVESRIASGKEKSTAMLNLYQQRIDLKAELAAKQQVSALDELEMAFIAVAKSFGERKGITHAAWREVGVPARVLRAAGIK